MRIGEASTIALVIVFTVLASLWVGVHVGIIESYEHGPKGACENLSLTILDCENM